VAEGGHRDLARAGATDVDHEQAERAPDGRVRAVARTEDPKAGVEPDAGADRAVDDDQRCREVRRGRHPVQVEGRIARRLGGGDQHG
jgi:hypothetical protein